jgi:hypothetical protein
MSVGWTELIVGIGSTEAAGSAGAGFAGVGAREQRRRRSCRRRERHS